MDGNKLVVKAGATLDYETATTANVTITTTDAGELTHNQTLTVDITNVN
jgi:hypothetical protein